MCWACADAETDQSGNDFASCDGIMTIEELVTDITEEWHRSHKRQFKIKKQAITNLNQNQAMLSWPVRSRSIPTYQAEITVQFI